MNTGRILIFSGYNDRAVTAFCRVAQKYGIPFSIIARDSEDQIFNTDYRDNVLKTRTEKALSTALFQQITESFPEKYVLLPSTEFLNRFALEHIEEFTQNGIRVPLVGRELYRKISDKLSFVRMCRQHGLAVPLEYPRPEHTPFVAKPKAYTPAVSKDLYPVIIDSDGTFCEFQKNCDANAYFYQEFVTGKSVYLLYYISRDGNVISFSQENFLQQAGGKSILYAKSAAYHKERQAKRYERLLTDAGFWGFIMIEVKVRGDEFVMIEANPRLWGPIQLCVDSDSGLIESFLRDNGYDVPCVPIAKDARYFWFGGLQPAEKMTYHGGFDACQLQNELQRLILHDVYNRKDTVNLFNNENKDAKDQLIKKLRALYKDGSKHSNYQNIPDFVQKDLGYSEQINESWRGDRERFEYLRERLRELLPGQAVIADVGANTGLFTFGLAHNNSSYTVCAMEINETHCEFMNLIKKAYSADNVTVVNKGLTLTSIDELERYDAMLHLNILHHAGFDFDADLCESMESQREYMIKYLKKLASHIRYLFLQVGFNWGGQKNNCLFSDYKTESMISAMIGVFDKSDWTPVDMAVFNGKERKFISYMSRGTCGWESVSYENDECSEFFKRPIFVLKSKIL